MLYSIIIPAYKVEDYIAKTVESVLRQACQDLECIVVDDGSPDATGAILDELALKDERLRVIHQENGGVSSARNAGIELARGEWLLFLDGDDMLGVDAIERLSRSIANHPNANLFRFDYVAFEDGKLDLPSECMVSPRRERVVDISSSIAFEDIFVYMWQFAYRRSMIGDLRFNLTYRRMEDRPFICDCLLNRNANFVDIGYVCLWYRQREGSAMHVVPPTNVWDGEIRYRIELIKMLDASGKTCDGLVQSHWISGFYQYDCLSGMRGRPAECRKALMRQWQRAAAFLQARNEFGRWRRFSYWVCSLSPSFALSVLVLCPIKYLRRDLAVIRPVAKLYRKVLRHGEFANQDERRK